MLCCSHHWDGGSECSLCLQSLPPGHPEVLAPPCNTLGLQLEAKQRRERGETFSEGEGEETRGDSWEGKLKEG